MIFLEEPPPGVRNRWKEGAEMQAAFEKMRESLRLSETEDDSFG